MSRTTSATAQATPLLLRNVRIGAGGPLGNLLIVDGRVASVTANVPDRAGRDIVDAGGRTVLPGFWDAHVHVLQWASARRRVDLSTAPSAVAAAREMADAAVSDRFRTQEPLIGFGFRDGLWADRLDPELLAWAVDRPVALVSNDLHTAWLGPGALRQLGHAGHPTGVLRERECLDAISRLVQAPPEIVDGWVLDAARAAAARGVVGFRDFERADNVAEWTRRAATARLDTRVTCSIYPQYLDSAIDARLRTGDVLPGSDGLVEVGPLKMFVDGSLNTRTALCNDPYPELLADEQPFGLLETGPDELTRLMGHAARHGIESAVHAIGDRANTIALDAFEHVGCAGRIEHAQLIDRRDLARFARPGLVLSIQPAHATDDRDVADRHWAGRTDRAFAYAELLRAGARLEIGSDAPVSPMDPWIGIAAAVHRVGDERDPWHPEQTIGLSDALAAASRGRRSIAVGDTADLVIVDQDPTHLAAHELRSMPVYGTLLAGRWTHRAECA